MDLTKNNSEFFLKNSLDKPIIINVSSIIYRISELLKHGYNISIPLLDAKIRGFLSVLVVFLWTYIILFLGPFMFLMMIYLTMTDYWWISLTYVTWMIYDHESPVTGGRYAWMTRVFRSWVGWKYWTKYFSLKIVKTHDLDAGHNYLIGSHPHGICAAGAFGAFSTDGADFSHLFPGISTHLHTLNCNFFAPLHRDWILGLGINNSSKQALVNILSEDMGGHASVVVVGGAAEALMSESESVKLILKKRKGFIKVALTTGAHLVPSFTFGETKLFSQMSVDNVPVISNLQNMIKQWTGVAPCIFNGRGLFQRSLGLMPRQRELVVVVGKPIPVIKTLHPSQEQIDGLHEQYVTQLRNIYQTFKHKFGDKHVPLEIL